MANNHLYLQVAEHPVGLKPHEKHVNLLLRVGTKDIRMIGIYGVGGIGKTTLAKAIYNSIAFRFEASNFLPIDSDTRNQVNHLVQLQETLLSKIFGECKSLKVDSIDMGMTTIKRRLRSKRVLLILDGVHHLDQLKKLAGACDWFGEGSRIIITTRDQHLLTAHGVDSTYEMTKLNHDDACQLFCWHAFRSEKPVDGYGEFVEQIINYAQGLPLALTVLGSDLNGRSEKSEWESALDQYRKIPHEEIQKILQTSYDRLSENEQNVFLDIAFFFNGEQLDDVIKILDSFGFYPNFSIPRLKEKCLISELNGMLQMHDLLRDMGKEVVRQESPKNPGARSRLFFYKDVRDVLEEDIGTCRVEAIVLDFPKGDDIIYLDPKAFKNLKRLRLFICRNAQFYEELNSLPDGIIVLDWPNCPLQSMPSKFRGNKLSILRMPNSRIQEIHLEYFKNLTVMKFWFCEFLTKLSDISSCPNLKEIDLRFCKNLVEVHDSVGFLDKLYVLHLYGCDNLKSFPRRLRLRSLRVLDLGDCSSLQNLPEIECEMKHLVLSDSDIVSIPSSIKTFVELRYLTLNDCKQLQEIKEFPPKLSELEASGCISLESLPEISKEFNFPRLKWIDLARCYKVNMGNWISNLALNRAHMIFPGKKIPDWFSYCKEITSNSRQCKFDIKVAPPYNLDDIIGIAFCAVFEPFATIELKFDITRGNTYASPYLETRAAFDEIDSDHVWLKYSTTEEITERRAVSVDNLRIIFKSSDPNSVILKRCGVHLLYKQHEQNAKDHAGVPHHENIDVHLNAPIEDIGTLANPMGGSQLSKRRRVDYDDYEDDHNIESNLYAQQRKPASTFEIKFFFSKKRAIFMRSAIFIN